MYYKSIFDGIFLILAGKSVITFLDYAL